MSDLFDSINVISFDALPTQAIALKSEFNEQALQKSKRTVGKHRKRQAYLNVLGQNTFDQWLRGHSPDLAVEFTHCLLSLPAANRNSGDKPIESEIITDYCCGKYDEAISYLNVKGFKICLITVDSIIDPFIQLPRVVVDIPEYAPHLFVVLRILEEAQHAYIWGILRYDKWIEQQKSNPIQVEQDWVYPASLSWFDRNPNHLLLHLLCSDPADILLPQIPSDRLTQISAMQAELVQQLPKAQLGKLWQHLTWEQATIVLTNSLLLSWLYQRQTGNVTLPQASLSELIKKLTQPAINLACWLRGEFDDLARSWAWQMLPFLKPVPLPVRSTRNPAAIESPEQQIQNLMKQLEAIGEQVPTEARGGYKDFSLKDVPLRLYLATWNVAVEQVSTWKVLLILTTQTEESVPDGIRLQVGEGDRILVEKTPEHYGNEQCLYIRLSGAYNEKFTVTVTLQSGEALKFPPFSFSL